MKCNVGKVAYVCGYLEAMIAREERAGHKEVLLDLEELKELLNTLDNAVSGDQEGLAKANKYERNLKMICTIIARYIVLDESYKADNACSPLSVCQDLGNRAVGRIQAYKTVLELVDDYFPEV